MKQSSWLKNIIALWRHLRKGNQRQFILHFVLTLFSVFAEIISIGAVIPFLGAMTAPDKLFHAAELQPLITLLGIESASGLLLPITLVFVFAAICSAGMRILQLWFNTKLTAKLGVQLRSEIFAITLNQPYDYHVAHNSSELISLTTEKVGAAIRVGILQVLVLATALVMSCGIVAILLYVNALIALSALVIIGGGYILTGYLVRKRIKKNGSIIALNQPEAIKCMQEGLGGIREVIIDNSQQEFSRTYTQAVKNLQYAGTQNAFLGGLPKYVLEVTGIVSIALLAYSLQAGATAAQQNVFPMLGAFVLGAQRLLPNLQQIYFSWSSISGAHAVLDDVVATLHQANPKQATVGKLIKPLDFKKALNLKDIRYRYSGSDSDVLDGVNLTIQKGTKTGFIGATGSGKSTLLDIIMGLLLPSGGQLIVDGVVIDKNNVQAWQRNIAHVSQSIFLSDASMAENIAFGVQRDKVNVQQVKSAAKLAQVDAFIETLPQGYQTLVGERGVRLSGGQRQRIGVARALYKQATVLVLDEATSALDSETEEEVMSAINNLGENLTILIIAHRLSTLEGCDRVVELAQGRIVREGSYKKMTALSSTKENVLVKS
jgi:ABC-type multidrug transport system fused ATPase/permease subunit